MTKVDEAFLAAFRERVAAQEISRFWRLELEEAGPGRARAGRESSFFPDRKDFMACVRSGGKSLGAVDDGLGQVGQVSVAAAGGAAQQGEGVFHVGVLAFDDDTLGLFDQDSAVQRGLQLFGQHVAVVDGALL